MLSEQNGTGHFARVLFGRFRLIVVFGIFLVAGWLGHWPGFVAAIIAHLAFTAIASQFLVEVYNLSDRWQAFNAFLCYVFAIGYPVLSICEGEIVSKHIRSPIASVGSPGLVVVDSNSAAVIVGYGQAKVLGPGTHVLGRGYRLRGAVDLRQQEGTYDLEKVFTRDGISLDIKVIVLYRVVQGEGILARQARHEASTPAVAKAILGTHDWKAQTALLAKKTVRDTIARFKLDSLLGLADTGEIPPEELQSLRRTAGLPLELVPRVFLQEELRGKLDAEAEQWGVEILKVTLDEILLPEPATERLLAAWRVHWTDVVESREADIEARAAVTRAEGERKAAGIKAEATKIMAEAEARAVQMKGEATAQAQAEIYRQKLAALQPLGRVLNEEDLLYLARALILDDVKSLEERLKARTGPASSQGRE